MMGKKIFSVLLASIMCIGATACGNSSESAASDSGGAAATAAESAKADEDGESEEELNISLIMKIGAAEYFDYLASGARAYSEEHPNVKVDINGPTSYTAYDEQLAMIETTLGADSYDAFIISPLQSETVAHLVSGQTKPIVAVDTDIDAPEVLSFIGTGNEDAAKSGAEKAVEIAKEAGWEEVNTIVFTGGQGDQTHEARAEGYRKGTEEAGGVFLEKEMQYCDASPDRACTAMESILQKYPEGIACILCTNDDMAMAAARIARESGNENYSNTVFCGFDGNRAACEAVQNKELTLTVAQDAYNMGYKSVETVVNASQGEELDEFIDSGFHIITEENAEEQIEKLKEIS